MDASALVRAGESAYYCLLFDISPGGARVRILEGPMPAVGTRATLELEGYGSLPVLVRSADSQGVGMMFTHGDEGEAQLGRWLLKVKPSRREVRHTCRIEARLHEGERRQPCIVTDISRVGAAAEILEGEMPPVGAEVVLHLPGYPPIDASVRHAAGRHIGLMLIDGFPGELPFTFPSLVTDANKRRRST